MIASKFPEAIEKASDLLRQEISAGKHQVVDSVVTPVVDSIGSSDDEVHDALVSMASSSTVPSLSKRRCSMVTAKISGLSVNGILEAESDPCPETALRHGFCQNLGAVAHLDL